MRTLKSRRLRWLTGLLVSVTLFVMFAPTTVGGATSYVIVSGSSMKPTLAEGDLVVVRQGRYEVGDIVAFETGNGLVIHRIVGGSAEEGFVMQGDNKPAPDNWTPVPEDVVGEYFAQLPHAGRWAHGLAANPALFGALIGGLGSLMIWNPRRRRTRRRAGRAETSRKTARSAVRGASVRGAGSILLVLAGLVLLTAGATAYTMLRPMQRTETVERALHRHQGEFAYTATVRDSVVYDSNSVISPANGSEPTPIYTQLLDELMVDFRYELTQAQPDAGGTVSAEMRVEAGDGLWARTIPLLAPVGFEGSSARISFPVDIRGVNRMIARAEEQTGFSPGTYQLVVTARVELEAASLEDPTGSSFVTELPMELNGTLLSVINQELTRSETVAETEERVVTNDIEVFGTSLPLRWMRASSGALLAMTMLGAVIFVIGLRKRLGRGDVARIRLRYGSLIVPVTGTAPNGDHPVDVGTIADLVRLARRSEQMVFHDQISATEHRFFVPDGSVTYQFRLSDPDQRAS
jgi:signal peptidase I